ncbi:MAG: hypothetical protein ABIN67_01020 [Ferruginibacter sp.]
MRTSVLMILLFSFTAVKAQRVWPGSLFNYTQQGFTNNLMPDDSLSQKKWSFSRYNAISTSVAFFKGGNATIISAPMSLQLNRRLANNWYAFANIAIAPAYTNFNSSFLNANSSKVNRKNDLYNSNGVDIYSSASLGLMYVNPEKTFSISGSISVERSSYPMLPYYPVNSSRPATIVPSKR